MAKKQTPAKNPASAKAASKAKPSKAASKPTPKPKPTAKPVAAKKPAPKAAAKKAAPERPVKSAPKNQKPAPKASKASKPAPKPSKPAPKPAAKVAPKPTPKPAAKAPAPVAKKAAAPPAAVAAPPPAIKTFIPNIARPTGMYGGVLLSEDVKPFPKKTPYSKSELVSLREEMVKERERLRHELASLEEMTNSTGGSGQESHGHSLHIAEHASDLTSTETNLVVRTLDEERLQQIEEALIRMDQTPNYGLCLACGAKVGIERLIAKPHAHLCMDCRRKYERERAR